MSLGDVTPTAWNEFGTVCRNTEDMITAAFGAEKFNYLALMMYDPEVHFHVIPRYSKPVSFEGREYTDPDWPNATQRIALNLDADTLRSIRDALVAHS
jgi:diadenosine tetraphosphate (Ap4A) HIT family hydrolase